MRFAAINIIFTKMIKPLERQIQQYMSGSLGLKSYLQYHNRQNVTKVILLWVSVIFNARVVVSKSFCVIDISSLWHATKDKKFCNDAFKVDSRSSKIYNMTNYKAQWGEMHVLQNLNIQDMLTSVLKTFTKEIFFLLILFSKPAFRFNTCFYTIYKSPALIILIHIGN